MIRVKSGVLFTRLMPPIYSILEAIDDTFADRGLDAVITSAEDGRHMATSRHYQGLALDLRSKHVPTKAEKRRIVRELEDAFGPGYDVILECEGGRNEHIHIEYDPED